MPTTDHPPDDTAHCAIRLRSSVTKLSHRLRCASRGDIASVAKLSVMGQLYRTHHLTATEIARLEGVKPQSLTRLLNELEADAWIRREPHPSDGRQSVLSLSPLGITLLRGEMRRRESALELAIRTRLSAAQRSVLLKACALMDELAESIPPAPDTGPAD